MPTNPKVTQTPTQATEWAATLEMIELSQLRFSRFSLECSIDPLATLPEFIGRLSYPSPTVKPVVIDGDKMGLIASVPIEAHMFPTEAPPESEPLVAVKVQANILYVQKPGLDSPLVFSQTFLDQFKLQAFFHAWPFLRAGVSDLFGKAGIASPLLPMLLVPPTFDNIDASDRPH